jgi:hypothetical protein
MARRQSAWLAALVLASGCAPTLTNPGPGRRPQEVATLVNAETALESLDGQPLHHLRSQDGARYEVLPGRHEFGVSICIVSANPAGYADIERSPNTAVFCIDAQAGHTYVLGHEGHGVAWRPTVVDETTHTAVPLASCSRA